jgi:ribose 5-phosphate isomerase A
MGQTAGAEEQKRLAGRRAAEYVESGQVVGLGTGSTVRYAIERLGERVAEGMKIIGVPTSIGTVELATRVGIPLAELNDEPRLDIAIDGADEIDPALNLIKGLGNALVREKLVEATARRLIVVSDESKLVPMLGSRAPVPVAIVPFGWASTRDRLVALGCRPVLRLTPEGEVRVTDDGLYIVDCWFGPIRDPYALEREIRSTLGVVSTGLFLDFPVTAVVARADSTIQTLARPVGRPESGE